MPFWKSVVPHDREIRSGERKFTIGDRSFNGYEHKKVWKNNGDGTFAEVGWATGGDMIVDARACAVADFDRDGRLDLVVRTMYERSYFLHNEGETGRFLHLSLVGTKSNRMGVGARVTLHLGTERRVAEMTCGSGYLSQNEPAIHFGLGARERVDRLVVRWPSGEVQEFRDVATNAFLTITEGNGTLRSEPPRPAARVKPRGRESDPVVTAVLKGKYTDLDGKTASAAPYLKETTLLHVWSPTCKGCEKEISTLRSLEKSVPILAIAVDAKPEAVRAFVEKKQIKYPVIVADEETGKALVDAPRAWRGAIRRQFGGWFEIGTAEESGIPWSGIIDRSGLQRCYRGPVKYFEAMLDILSTREEAQK